MGFFDSSAEEDSLSRSQAIGFHYYGSADFRHIALGLVRLGKYAEIRGGHSLFPHNLFGKRFTRFELRGLAAWAEDTQPMGLKLVHQPQAQGQFRTNHGEVDTFLFGKASQTMDIIWR
jgi:hypothetical protein